MGLVISAARGKVVVVSDPTVPANIKAVTVDGWGGGESMNAIITRCSVSQIGNFQFLHTLGNYIYVYVFGDRMGQLSLSGLAFDSSCNSSVQGVSRVLDFYQQNRIAKRATPVKITLGTGPTLEGFLISGDANLAEAYDLIWQFDFNFSLIPPQD